MCYGHSFTMFLIMEITGDLLRYNPVFPQYLFLLKIHLQRIYLLPPIQVVFELENIKNCWVTTGQKVNTDLVNEDLISSKGMDCNLQYISIMNC